MRRNRDLLKSASLLAGLFCIVGTAASSRADWLNFRGSISNSIATTTLPETCTEENVAWKSELPGRGVSSPIVVAGKVFVTASSGVRQDRLHILCFDVATGERLWERQFWATGRTLTHSTSAVAAPSPASDGERVYAFFSSNDAVCVDLDGNLQWFRGLAHDFPKAGNDIGMSSSPVVAAGVAVFQVENQGDSFVTGVDALTGEPNWRVDRPREANWSSPILLAGTADQADLCLLKGDEGIVALDMATGREVWNYEMSAGGIPSAVVADGKVYVPGDRLTVLDIASHSQASFAWDSTRIKAGPSSPIVYDGRLLALNSAGVLSCFSATDGEQQWQLRLKGPYWATPLVAGNRLYAVNQDGQLQVVSLEGTGEQVSTLELSEPVLGSPAADQGALFVRSEKHLWKISDAK